MDCLMDQQMNPMMYGWNFPRIQTFRKFNTVRLIRFFTMNLADGWMDGTHNGHTERQMEFQVESHWDDRQMSDATDIRTDLLC